MKRTYEILKEIRKLKKEKNVIFGITKEECVNGW